MCPPLTRRVSCLFVGVRASSPKTLSRKKNPNTTKDHHRHPTHSQPRDRPCSLKRAASLKPVFIVATYLVRLQVRPCQRPRFISLVFVPFRFVFSSNLPFPSLRRVVGSSTRFVDSGKSDGVTLVCVVMNWCSSPRVADVWSRTVRVCYQSRHDVWRCGHTFVKDADSSRAVPGPACGDPCKSIVHHAE